jgi:hypothetical protein
VDDDHSFDPEAYAETAPTTAVREGYIVDFVSSTPVRQLPRKWKQSRRLTTTGARSY